MRPLHIVDVFAERAGGGNPLAVVLDAEGMSVEAMQRVAAETNYSETTFVMAAREPGAAHRVRIFTPAREIAFAGHPILGTAWVIRRHVQPAPRVDLAIPAGIIPVTFDDAEVAWFAAPAVTLGRTYEREAIAAALAVAPSDLADAPIREAAAGVAAVIVPVASLRALRACTLDLAAWRALGAPPLVYLFSRETHDARNDLCARFFFEAHGVREDPATGNGAAFLGAYLMDRGERSLDLRIEQGHEVHRPSLVRLRARDNTIEVGGTVVPFARGELVERS